MCYFITHHLVMENLYTWRNWPILYFSGKFRLTNSKNFVKNAKNVIINFKNNFKFSKKSFDLIRCVIHCDVRVHFRRMFTLSSPKVIHFLVRIHYTKFAFSYYFYYFSVSLYYIYYYHYIFLSLFIAKFRKWCLFYRDLLFIIIFSVPFFFKGKNVLVPTNVQKY